MKKPNNLGFAPLVLIVIIVAALAVGGFIYWHKTTSEIATSPIPTFSPPCCKASPTATEKAKPTNKTSPTLSVTYLQPISGRYGTSVTITGTGFTPTGNKIKFGDLNTENDPKYNLTSTNGTTLTFTVPKYPYVSCKTGDPCVVFSGSGRTGTFNVSVINTNGVSNSVSFTTLPPEFPEP